MPPPCCRCAAENDCYHEGLAAVLVSRLCPKETSAAGERLEMLVCLTFKSIEKTDEMLKGAIYTKLRGRF